jgi:hypothetical protein
VSRTFLRQCLLVGAIICGIAVAPATLLLAFVAYHVWLPRYSAVADFEEYGFNLRLDLYQTADEMRDSGRYLSVITDSAYHTFMLAGWDWARKARTSLYRIDDGHIAVLSALGYDYQIAVHPFAVAPMVSDIGARWQYLGAFDFAFPPGERPRLQFFDRQLVECIPMVDDPSRWTAMPRAQARHASCPTPQPQ